MASFPRPRDTRGKYIHVVSESSVVNMWGRGEIDNNNYLLAMDILSERLYRKLIAVPRPHLSTEICDEFTYEQKREATVKSA